MLPEQLFVNGFAACCEDVALPFRKYGPLILGCALAFESEGGAQILKGLDPEGQSRILTTDGKAEAIVFGCGTAALRFSGAPTQLNKQAAPGESAARRLFDVVDYPFCDVLIILVCFSPFSSNFFRSLSAFFS